MNKLPPCRKALQALLFQALLFPWQPWSGDATLEYNQPKCFACILLPHAVVDSSIRLLPHAVVDSSQVLRHARVHTTACRYGRRAVAVHPATAAANEADGDIGVDSNDASSNNEDDNDNGNDGDNKKERWRQQ